MGYSVYKVGHRWGGYGIPAYCEHPDCNEEIDRGMGYACGGEPFSEVGCDMYFCGNHLEYVAFDAEGKICEHTWNIGEKGCDCKGVELCKSCASGGKIESYPYKPEHPTWLKHILKDESWKQWREENPKQVSDYKAQLTIYKKLNKN